MLDSILTKLQLKGTTGLCYLDKFENEWTKKVPFRIKKSLEIIKPDAFYCFENQHGILQPYILFFNLDNPPLAREKEIHKQIWNFNETPIVFIIKNEEIQIYNGFIFNKKNSFLKKLNINEDKFSFSNLYNEKTWQELQGNFRKKTRVDEFLLKNIETAREKLIEKKLNGDIADKLIGRLIFSRYLIDRQIPLDSRYIVTTNLEESKKSFLQLIKNKTELYKYFHYLKERFNGDLFPIEDGEEKTVNEDEHLSIIYSLFNGDDLALNQASLFEYYDFSIIPIELISNIYEKFIGEENQNKLGAFYTPPFLVDYILSQTVVPFLKENPLNDCKVLDPACGSGVFLVETFRKIVEKRGEEKALSPNDIKQIIKDNIFGIDIDSNAINIAIFSLCITILDYLKKEDIKNFKFPTLKESNFFRCDFFDEEKINSEKLKDINFIIGNPPWGSKKGKHEEYCKKNDIPISDRQIAQSFIARAKDIGSSNTVISFIVTSKILYNLSTKAFRNYLLTNFTIIQLLELSSVRRLIFNERIAPPIIIFYKHSESNEELSKNITTHITLKPNIFFKLFRTIVVEKYDFKRILQTYFVENDWLWKTMLYGNIADYFFINRLKSKFNNLSDFLTQNNIGFGVGYKIQGTNHKHNAELKHYKLLNTQKFKPFYLELDTANHLEAEYFHDFGKIKAYKSPHLLINRTIVKNYYKPTLAYSSEDCVFPDRISGLFSSEENVSTLKTIGGLLSSDLMQYLLFMLASQWGVEREEIYKNEYLPLPIPENIQTSTLDKLFDKISEASKEKETTLALNRTVDYDQIIDTTIEDINKEVFNFYNISNIEKDLITYTRDVSIPMFYQKDTPFKATTKENLMDFAQAFIDYFKPKFQYDNKYFYSDIYQTTDVIAMNFRVTKSQKTEQIEFRTDANIEKFIGELSKLQYEEITKDLFIYKDIKGFEKDSFYIIKPNEYKNWHKAIAWLDINEFANVLVKKELKQHA
jgi:hypothetical protein